MKKYTYSNDQWEESTSLFIENKSGVAPNAFLKEVLNHLNFPEMEVDHDSISKAENKVSESDLDLMLSQFGALLIDEISLGVKDFKLSCYIKNEWNEKLFFVEAKDFYILCHWETSA